MNWCITSLLLGDKYKKFAEVFCKKFAEVAPKDERPEVIFVTDNLQNLNISEYEFVTIKILPKELLDNINVHNTMGTGTVRKFDYSLKRWAFQFSLDLGYTDICFIDIDIYPRVWDLDIFDSCNERGLWVGRGYPSSGFGSKPVTDIKDVTFTPKLQALKDELQYSTDWVNYRMPFEAVMLLRGFTRPEIQTFIDNWGMVSDATKRLGLVKSKVCHEIGISADMCNIPIFYNKKLLSVIFKHFIMSHSKLLDIHSMEIKNDS
jgi:hypothetical protein